MQTIAFCEIEKYCQKVLKKHWPNVPIFEDIKTLNGADIGPIDIICGGYPCQPFSLAGKRAGQQDDRHLWPEMLRIIQETNPRWFIGENVTGHISMGLDQVLFDLESEGYETQTFIIPACAVDAPHRRDRVWITAHADAINSRQRSDQQPKGPQPGRIRQRRVDTIKNIMANAIMPRSQERKTIAGGKKQTQSTDKRQTIERNHRWPAEPGVRRVAHGIPNRVDRIKGLGNAVVPQIPEIIGRAIMAIEEMTHHAHE